MKLKCKPEWRAVKVTQFSEGRVATIQMMLLNNRKSIYYDHLNRKTLEIEMLGRIGDDKSQMEDGQGHIQGSSGDSTDKTRKP